MPAQCAAGSMASVRRLDTWQSAWGALRGASGVLRPYPASITHTDRRRAAGCQQSSSETKRPSDKGFDICGLCEDFLVGDAQGSEAPCFLEVSVTLDITRVLSNVLIAVGFDNPSVPTIEKVDNVVRTRSKENNLYFVFWIDPVKDDLEGDFAFPFKLSVFVKLIGPAFVCEPINLLG